MNFGGFAINVAATCVALLTCGGVSDHVSSSNASDTQEVIKENTPNNSLDDACWTNINKEVDMALQMIWPVMVEKGYTSFELPDMTESLSLTPLFLTYAARLHLTNGLLSNIEGLSRYADAMMTYHNKSFQFCMDLVIRNVEFIYNYTVGLIAIEIQGKVGGAVQNIIVTGNFSISVETSDIKLNYFQIRSFDPTVRGCVSTCSAILKGLEASTCGECCRTRGREFKKHLRLSNIEIRLKHNSITSQLSGSLPRPLTDLFKDRIIAIVSDAVRIKLEKLIDDINENDRLHFKEFGRISLAGLLG